jgi:Concanavalin A-like lectin/glucanases superfamily
MDRGQIVVIAVVVAALGLFGLKIWSDRSAGDDLLIASNDPSALQDGVAGEGGGSFGASGGGHMRGGPGGRLGGPGGSIRGRRGLPGSRAQGGSGSTVIGGARGFSGGVLGRSGSSSSGRGDSVVSHLPPRSGERSDLVDFLSSQPPSGNEILGDNNNNSNTPGDVALQVKNVTDSSKALESSGIEEPQNGQDGIHFTDNSQLTFPDAGGASGKAGTISFDIQPDWSGGDQTDNSLVQIRGENQWSDRLQLVKNGRYLRFIIADSQGREADISVPIDAWQPGDSHSVTASWGDSRTSLYIDGRLAGTNSYDAPFNIPPGTPLHLGSDYSTGTYSGADATISGFTIYKNSQHP